ncbi:hypothetical protein KC19_2G242700 [Ceratodon purpureus]|uniref:Uncharacterized protein n=1 Tax=Ceratodon purpureus TaxID=3225 RepID=A0A8T0IYX0_CERPU|nr:hypothetical protein KC19_2G242700 [Ceratodon purpureus]
MFVSLALLVHSVFLIRNSEFESSTWDRFWVLTSSTWKFSMNCYIIKIFG